MHLDKYFVLHLVFQSALVYLAAGVIRCRWNFITSFMFTPNKFKIYSASLFSSGTGTTTESCNAHHSDILSLSLFF